jgi:hypothetical protein
MPLPSRNLEEGREFMIAITGQKVGLISTLPGNRGIAHLRPRPCAMDALSSGHDAVGISYVGWRV